MPTSASTSAAAANTNDANANTLSSVVSNLVRASMGTSLSPTVTDEDLDRHVAELILREAKKKAEKYNQQGIRAYITSNLQDSNAPRANKRFLSSIIRSTDDHNKAVLRAQAQAAEEIKRARREQEKRERRARAEEAVNARRETENYRRSSKLTFSSWRDKRVDERKEGWDRWNGRTADREKERRKRKNRSWETWNGDSEPGEEAGESERRRREKGKDKERSQSRSKDRADQGRRRRRRKVNEDDDQGDDERHRRRRTPRLRRDDEERREGDRHRRRRSRSRSPSQHRSKWKTSSSRHPRSRSSSPSAQNGRKNNDNDDTFSDVSDAEKGIPRKSEHRETELRELLKSSRMKDGKHPSDAIPKLSSLRESSPNPLLPSHKHKFKSTKPSSRGSSHTPSMPLSPRSPSPHADPVSRFGSLSPSRFSSPSPGPSPAPELPSKMDKYFEENYDPRLDVGPLNTKPNIPATGLIDNAEFEGWDAMLELIRMRKEDKEERKRLERLGLLDKDKKSKKGKSKGLVSASTTVGSSSVLDIEYKKRGSVREWDLGKEGVDLSF